MWSYVALITGLIALLTVVFRARVDDLIGQIRKTLDKRHCTHADCKGSKHDA